MLLSGGCGAIVTALLLYWLGWLKGFSILGVDILFCSVVAGLLVGLKYADRCRTLAARLALPPWPDYAHRPGTDRRRIPYLQEWQVSQRTRP
jgi:hypothetical protein